VLDEHETHSEGLARAQAAVLREKFSSNMPPQGGHPVDAGFQIFPHYSREITVERTAHLMSQEAGRVIAPRRWRRNWTAFPGAPAAVLGARHMLQLAFDVQNLARDLGASPGRRSGVSTC